MLAAHQHTLLVLQRVLRENDLDLMNVFITVVSMERVAAETLIGKRVVHLLTLVAEEASVSVDAIISLFREGFYGTKQDGKMGVCKVKSSGEVMWKNARKKVVLQLYLDKLFTDGSQFPSLIQVIYAGKDSKSGARVHHVYKYSQDCIISCRDMIIGRGAPLSIMEVPNQLQGTAKFYIDWDMKLERLVFLKGSVSERVDQARELALQVPAKICAIFIDLGYISSDAHVQIVIKEGSRSKVDGVDIDKISFHFIFNLFGTSGQIVTISEGLFQYIRDHAGTLSTLLANNNACIVEIDALNGYECFLGIDMHPYSNPEQGLAMGFSRKDLRDPYSRFIEILHVR
jgi:hypothetical protein